MIRIRFQQNLAEGRLDRISLLGLSASHQIDNSSRARKICWTNISSKKLYNCLKKKQMRAITLADKWLLLPHLVFVIWKIWNSLEKNSNCWELWTIASFVYFWIDNNFPNVKLRWKYFFENVWNLSSFQKKCIIFRCFFSKNVLHA